MAIETVLTLRWNRILHSIKKKKRRYSWVLLVEEERDSSDDARYECKFNFFFPREGRSEADESRWEEVRSDCRRLLDEAEEKRWVVGGSTRHDATPSI